MVRDCPNLANAYRPHLISEVTPLPAKQYTFVSSGIDDYIEDYFSEIIGVDNVPTLPVSDIRFAVKKTAVNRLMDNPLHESMTLAQGRGFAICQATRCSACR